MLRDGLFLLSKYLVSFRTREENDFVYNRMNVEALSSLCFRNTTRTSSHPRLDFKRRLKINRRNFTFDVIAIRKDLSEDLSAVIKDIPLPCNLQIAFVNIQYFERAFDELLSNHRRIPITCRRNVMGQTWPNNIRD